MLRFLRRRRRARLKSAPFPPHWRKILKSNVRLLETLPKTVRQEVEGHIQVLLHEKNFEGCGGLELTDEIRVTIAAHAALLHVGRDHYFPRLISILVYPESYAAPVEHHEGGLVIEDEEERLGESWGRGGVVVLAWDDARRAAHMLSGGDNVILHEFAHQLDSEDGRSDGVPLLDRHTDYAAWARVLAPEFARLQSGESSGVLSDYGATNEAEFFAVATEAFFGRPQALRTSHPALYAELSRFYRLDLADTHQA